jgi:hypothetical protein
MESKKSEFVKVQITWNPIQFPLEMKIYELKSELPHKLWETNSVSSIEKSPLSTEIPDSKLSIQSGRYKEFALGVKNSTNDSIYFFAAPHQASPPEYSLGFKFKCLCVNHAFEIPAGEFWYRVVRLSISKDFIGENFTIKHDLVGISKDRMKDFSSKKELNNSHDEHDRLE